MLIAPIIGWFAPERAARMMVRARGWTFLTVLIGQAAALAGTIVLLWLWNDTIDLVRVNITAEVSFRSLTGVWWDWHGDGAFGFAERCFLSSCILYFSFTALLTWLLFPYTHMTGSLWTSFWHVFRAVVGSAGVALPLTALLGANLVVLRHLALLNAATGLPFQTIFGFVLEPALILVGVAVTLRHTARGVRAIRAPVPTFESPPRCEGCGYDLTHRPELGFCSECGMPLDDSLKTGHKRKPCNWERDRRWSAWMMTTVSVLRDIKHFYSTIVVRTKDDDARWFAFRHWVCTGFFAGICVGLAGPLGNRFRWPEATAWTLIATIGWPLLAWLFLHANATLVIFWWAARGSRLRLYLTRKIICYEAAYTSLVFSIAAMFVASFLFYGEWMTDWFGSDAFRRVFHTSAEAAFAIVAVTVASGICHWRVTVAIREVRWSNF